MLEVKGGSRVSAPGVSSREGDAETAAGTAYSPGLFNERLGIQTGTNPAAGGGSGLDCLDSYGFCAFLCSNFDRNLTHLTCSDVLMLPASRDLL